MPPMISLRLCTLVLAFFCIVSMAGAQVFEPSDYGTVSLHLKGDDLTLANNAAVAQWGPMTAASTGQPTFIASDARFNNKPVVRFDGNSDFLTWSSANLNARTIFAVTTLESGAQSLAGLISNGGDGLNIRRNNTTLFYRSPGNGLDEGDFAGNGTPDGTLSVNNVQSGSYTAGVPHLVMAVAGSQKNFSTFVMGRPNATLGRYWNGSVAEVLVYEGTLTQAGRDAVGYYLQQKYNLPTNFPQPTPKITNFTATNAGGISSDSGVISTAGANVTLFWSVDNASSVSIAPAGTVNAPGTSGSQVVAPQTTTTYTLTATNPSGSSTRQVTVHVGVTPEPPTINEFLADNENGLQDEDGEFLDWIEIYNPNPYAVDLHGYALRSGGSKASATQWDFPAGTVIAAGGYRLVFASQKNRIDPSKPLHTSFRLGKAGEYLALVRVADNLATTEFAPFPPQYTDVSYGHWQAGQQPRYFGPPTGSPTPGAPNNAGVLGFLDETDDTKFTVGRGHYTSVVTTTISASTPGAMLIYTTNGSIPTLTNGTRVQPPDASTPPSVTMTIHPANVPAGSPGVNIASIGGVTTLRVAAFLDGYAPTNVDTQTYVFPQQVLGQTISHAVGRGFPSSAVNGQLFKYGMDPGAASSYTPTEMIESLQSIPTLSIVTDIRNLVDPNIGIYVNADQHGGEWERPISVELIHPPGYVSPDGNPTGFQIDGGLRIRGGYSRNDQFFKHGLRLFFSRKYDGKLKYPLFGKEGTDTFGKLDLGTGSNYAWYREGDFNSGKFNTMVRDPFARDTQGALGQPNTKSRYYHLYLNGHYWGIYYSEERAEADYAASYFGGDDSEYDTVKCANHIGNFETEATDGTLEAWHKLWQKTRTIGSGGATVARFMELEGRNPDGTRNPAMPVLLDVDNLIDEMIVIFYMGDGDAVLSSFHNHDRPNNWFSVFRRDGRDGFRFFIRDAEHTLGAPSWVADQTGPWTGTNVYNITYANPQSMHQDLMKSPEYRLRFADRVRKHFFDDGALTSAQSIARFQARANQLRNGMKAESARWGSAQSISNLPAGHPPRYVVADWESAIAYVTNTVMPGRSNTVLGQLAADGLYPSLAAPTFRDADGNPHYGGAIASGFELRISAPNGTIYYTVDGSDPRLPGGAVSPSALSATSLATLNLAATTTVQARSFNPTNSMWSALTKARYVVGAFASAGNLVISKVHYNPPGSSDAQEFIEVMNISSGTIDLTNCRFTAGIDFTFPEDFLLGPGERCVVVRDLAAFQLNYPEFPAEKIAGSFANETVLKNEGEELTLVAADNSEVQRFSYGVSAPWPSSPDGLGPCLVLINPTSNPDHTRPENWRASTVPRGTPGASDALQFGNWLANNGVTDPSNLGDDDKDGIPHLVEYVLGTNPREANSVPGNPVIQEISVNGTPADYFTLRFTAAIGRDDAVAAVEASGDPNGPWTDAVRVGEPLYNGDGMETHTFRHPAPVTSSNRQFLRVKATRRP